MRINYKFSIVSILWLLFFSFLLSQLFWSVFNIWAYSSNKYSRTYLEVSDFSYQNLQLTESDRINNSFDPLLVFNFGKELYLSNLLLDLRDVSSEEIQIQVYHSNPRRGISEFTSVKQSFSTSCSVFLLHIGSQVDQVRIDIGVDGESYNLKKIVVNPHVSDIIKATFADISYTRWFCVFILLATFLHLYSNSFIDIQKMIVKFMKYIVVKRTISISEHMLERVGTIFNNVFFIFLFLYLTKYYISIGSMLWTKMPKILEFNDLFLCLSFIFATAAIIRMLFDKNWLYLVIAICLLLCFSLSHFMAGNDVYVLINICIVVACYSVPHKLILKTFVFAVGLVVIVEVAMALLDIIPNLKYSSARGFRYALGANYPTDFSAAVLYLLLAVWLLMKKRMVVLLLIIIGFVFLQYRYTITRNSTICSFVFILFVLFEVLSNKYSSSRIICFIKRKFISNFALWAFLLFTVITVGLSYYYDNSNKTLSYVNRLFSGRFEITHKNMIDVGLSLFGRFFVMMGLGGTTAHPGFYNFVDSSYCNILLRFGALPLMVLVVSYMFFIRRTIKFEEYKLICTMVVVALHCAVEHHYLDICYNIFLLLMFANFNCSYNDKSKTEG